MPSLDIEQLTYGQLEAGFELPTLQSLDDHPDICIHIHMEYNIYNNCVVIYEYVYTKTFMQSKMPIIIASISSTLILYY